MISKGDLKNARLRYRRYSNSGMTKEKALLRALGMVPNNFGIQALKYGNTIAYYADMGDMYTYTIIGYFNGSNVRFALRMPGDLLEGGYK